MITNSQIKSLAWTLGQEYFAGKIDARPSDWQTYTYAADPEGDVHTAYRDNEGNYHAKGKRITLDVRRAYHDYSF